MTVAGFHTRLFPPGATDREAARRLAGRGLLHHRAEEFTGIGGVAALHFVSFFRSESIDCVVVLAEDTRLMAGVSRNQFIEDFRSGPASIPFCETNLYLERELARSGKFIAGSPGETALSLLGGKP